MVKIKFLGACREVGRSGVLIESEQSNDKILCDYGTMMDGGQHFPESVRGKDLSAVVLSHSHIDHSGALPLFYISGAVPLYTTSLTYRVTEVLLRDMIHLNSKKGKSDSYLPFDRPEIYTMRKHTRYLNYGQKQKVGKNSWITLFNAGHIPGSAMILVEMDGKRIIYTGDFNTVPTRLLDPADPKEMPSIDAIILETTYGTTIHSPRREIEDALVESVLTTLNNQGTALIPAFGVARSQEILMVLNRSGVKLPITIDGMARKVSYIYRKFPQFFRDPEAFDYALSQTHFINQRRRSQERQQAADSLGVIVAPSGMLKGGTARFYFEELMFDPKNSINLVSYQVEGTPGRILMEKGVYLTNDSDKPSEVAAKVKHFDFSSHIGKNGLIKYLNNLKFRGGKNVFCVHGDKETMAEFSSEISKLGYQSAMPLPLDEYQI